MKLNTFDLMITDTEKPKKILINSRDELVSIDVGLVAVVKANGNYCLVYYINKRETLVALPIGQLDTLLKARNDSVNRFVKVGRSFIINQRYLHRVDLPRQLLYLSDGSPSVNDLIVKMSKNLLRTYKNAIVESIKLTNNTNK